LLAGVCSTNAAPKEEGYCPVVAANDPKFGDDPPDCEAMRALLNRMFHVINQYSLSPTADPLAVQVMWMQFSLHVKRYEKDCGPYNPPPSMHDIYTK
jgi:hypothetical protein